MALECPRCGHESDQGTPGQPCPKCGVNMRFTMLGDYLKERKQAEQAKIKEQRKAPGAKERFGRWLAGFVSVQLFAALLAGGGMMFLAAKEMSLDQAAAEYKTEMAVAALGIPIVATFLGVTLTCGQVYLAQLVGFAIGLTANLALLGERLFSPAPAGWQEWVATPVIGAIVGFLSGYRITGPMFKEEPQQVEKKDDEWRTAAPPAIRQLDPGMTVRRQRMIAGAIVGLLFPYVVPFILRVLMSAFTGRPEMVKNRMDSLEFLFLLLAMFVAGVTAGSSNTKGVRQGVWVGLAIYFTQFALSGGADWQTGLIRFLPSILVSMFGGYMGQKVFPPTQIYTGPRIR